MILQGTGSQPFNFVIHGLICQAQHLSCGMYTVAAAPYLTLSCRLASAKPFIQFRHRTPVLDPAVHSNALWLHHHGPLSKSDASRFPGEFLKKDAYEQRLSSDSSRGGGQTRPQPNSSLFQFNDVEPPFSGLRTGGRRLWCLAGHPPWGIAETSFFLEPARMGRQTSLRARPADSQQKTQLQDIDHEPCAHSAHSEEITLPQGGEILGQPTKMLAEKQVQLEARLAAFQKAGNLAELTVAELKGIMKLRSRPTKGRKQDLLQELERLLAEPADLGDAEKQLEECSQMANAKLLTPQDSDVSQRKRGRRNVQPARGKAVPQVIGQGEVGTGSEKLSSIEQERHISNARISGEAVEVDSVIKVYRSRRARARDDDTKVDIARESKLPVKRTKIAGSGGSNVTVVVTEGTALKEIWATFNHKRPQPGWYAYDPSTMRPAPPTDRSTFQKVVSWNVNGVRALLKGKDPKSHDAVLFKELAEAEDFDILCLQETKLQEKDVDKVKQCLLPQFEGSYWSCSTAKLGYSGTAIISRVKPLSVNYGLGIAAHDKEGRLITAEYDSFYLVTSYVPNSGDGLKRLDYRITGWDPSLSRHVKELEKKKPVILTGDLNCCHQEMDIADPNANRRSAGFTDEERHSFEECYLKKGLVDTFRQQHPNAVGYTYWGYRTGARARNHGWRLDYFLASEGLRDRLYDSYSMPHVHGSDHCPIGLILKT